MESDHYVQSAEFYDILSAQHWASRRKSIEALLRSVSDVSGVVLDVGAGTGVCTRIIADALPEARILAIEPSASMRVGLMTRILLDNDLRKRVTVNAASIQNADLPEGFVAALVCGCIGYLDYNERLRMWQELAARIAPGGFVVADVMPLDRPQVIPDTKLASVDVGDQKYEIWLSGTPGEDDVMQWDMRCNVLQKTTTIRSFNVVRQWHTFGIRQLAEEAGRAGFQADIMTDSPVPAATLRAN